MGGFGALLVGIGIIVVIYGLIQRAKVGRISAPLFQTGDPRYAYVNNVLGVGIGRSNPTGVVYDIYAVK